MAARRAILKVSTAGRALPRTWARFSAISSVIFSDAEAATPSSSAGVTGKWPCTSTLQRRCTGASAPSRYRARSAAAIAKAAARAPEPRRRAAAPAMAPAISVFSRACFPSASVAPPAAAAAASSPDPCGECSGKGVVARMAQLKVRIPPGADNNSVLRLAGDGEPGLGGGPNGDLRITLEVSAPPRVSPRGRRPILRYPHITLAEAALGAQIEVPTLQGQVRMKVPPGTQSGRVFRLRGKGVARMGRGTETGDLHATVVVETPHELSEPAKRAARGVGQNRPAAQLSAAADAVEQVQGELARLATQLSAAAGALDQNSRRTSGPAKSARQNRPRALCLRLRGDGQQALEVFVREAQDAAQKPRTQIREWVVDAQLDVHMVGHLVDAACAKAWEKWFAFATGRADRSRRHRGGFRRGLGRRANPSPSRQCLSMMPKRRVKK